MGHMGKFMKWLYERENHVINVLITNSSAKCYVGFKPVKLNCNRDFELV